MKSYSNFDHNEHAKTVSRQDFWGQIRRTVNGVAVEEIQIDMIVDAINKGMQISHNDFLLDIGCGNGALSEKIAKNASTLTGIDNSDYLISVAKEFFESKPKSTFVHTEIDSFMEKLSNESALHYTKFVCYGAFSYLSERIISSIFKFLDEKFLNTSIFYIGNIPNIEQTSQFFVQKLPSNIELSSCQTSIGKWWKKSELIDLANTYGWRAKITEMPSNFYGSRYRFDAILYRDCTNLSTQ